MIETKLTTQQTIEQNFFVDFSLTNKNYIYGVNYVGQVRQCGHSHCAFFHDFCEW